MVVSSGRRLVLQRILELQEEAAVAHHALAFLEAAGNLSAAARRLSPSVTRRRANCWFAV